MRIKIIRIQKALLLPTLQTCGNNTAAGAAGTHYYNVAANSLRQRRFHSLMNAAHTAAGVDKAMCACCQCRIHKYAILTDMRVDDIHARQSSNTAHIKFALQCVRTHAAIIVMYLTANYKA